jgi:hypothetical protein
MNYGDLRVFIAPPRFSKAARFALSMLCDSGEYSELLLSTSMPEVVWRGHARGFPLRALISIPAYCDLVIVVGRQFRREWFRVGEEGFHMFAAGSLGNYLYRETAPWCAVEGATRLGAYAQIHILPYFSDVHFSRGSFCDLEGYMRKSIRDLWD